MQLRLDIQALRGFAVLIILLYHAGIGPFAAGYLGVDIFFVISGFLITTLLIKHMEHGDFSFREFYYRRAKRLLPAAYVVLFLTTIASYFFLTVTEYNEYKHQLLGALTFTVNMVLSAQTDYFGGAAEMKPLLHFWSLAIEEQFYLFLPVCLFFLPRKWWKIAAPICVGVSLLACMILVQKYPQETFYYLPTRAWELGIGCLGAIFAKELWLQKWSAKLLWPAIAVIVVLPIAPIMKLHPGPDALLVCIATLAIIMARADKLNSSVLIKPLAKIGDYSYSLYLVHWPLFALMANAYIGTDVPLPIRAGLLLLSIIFAVALYHLVEKPIHRRSFQRRRTLVAPLVLSSIALGCLVYVLALGNTNFAKYADKRLANRGLFNECAQSGTYEPLKQCQTSEHPKMLVWGDSHAMHLVGGLAKTYDGGVMQATRSSCAPILGVAAYDGIRRSISWAKECIAFNDSVFEELARNKQIEIIVLSSSFGNYTSGKNTVLKRRPNGAYSDLEPGVAAVVEQMTATVRKIQALGKRVLVVSSPPRNHMDIGLCLERQKTHKIILGNQNSCVVTISAARPHGLSPHVDLFLRKIMLLEGGSVLYLSDLLCKDDVCETTINGTPLYRDAVHLSNGGSIALFENRELTENILRVAR